jgi:hypothetical protein
MVVTALMGFAAMLMFYLGSRRLPADLARTQAATRTAD